MLTKQDIKARLEKDYKRAEWTTLLDSLFNADTRRTEWYARPQAEPLGTKAAEYCAKSITELGKIKLTGNKVVAVYECEVHKATISKMRVGLRRLMKDKIIPGIHDAVFAVFHSPDQREWRFTFVSKHEKLDEESGGTINVETDPKRYTYVFGSNQSCRTAAIRFETLQREASLQKVENAFKVAPLFKDFYSDYKAVFYDVKAKVQPQFDEDDIKDPAQLFTQRLFNRLMFLAFIQRKGWLKINGDTDYLAALYRNYRKGHRSNFYKDILRPLFFEGLNQDERPAGHVDPRFGQVPYLNGGLFEKADDKTDDSIREIPDEAFIGVLHPDDGLFAKYNFTASENTPLDVEVAVDPEMLGKVFEELVTGRHKQGSYYTPKQIVSFMGRAALAEYLSDTCPKEKRDALETFVHEHKADDLRNPELVLEALRTVKVCDPACGSGAYLLGMLHELLELRTCLFKSNKKLDGVSDYDRKLTIIERNLYGVDIDDFAVNIARLRLWLSLAVDFEGVVPPPLPNLDFKIEQGDSLAARSPQEVIEELNLHTSIVVEYRALKAKHLREHGMRAAKLEEQIAAKKEELRSWLGADGPANAFQWPIEFAEVFLTEHSHSTVGGALNLGHELSAPPQPGGFDIIVANPPYVRMELIKPQKPILRKRFPHVHAERADLYVYFYARAHELLREGGVSAFISSNRWLRSGYGEALRRLLLDAQAFHSVMDFGELKVFEGANTDAAIFIWQKEARADASTRWATVKDLSACYAEGVREHFTRLGVDVPARQFGAGKPRLTTTASATLLDRMKIAGPILKDLIGGEPKRGIVTGVNDAFRLTRDQRDDLIAKTPKAGDIIKPMLEGEDVRHYESHYRETYLIYAYHGIRIADYPSVQKHLLEYRSYKDKKGNTVGLDHRATEQEWFELQQPQMAYRKWFDGRKILYPEIGKTVRFVLDEENRYLNNKCFFLPTDDWYLLGVLNSASVFAYLKEVCATLGDKDMGGRLEFRAQYMEQLPIPDASAADRKQVSALAQRAQSLHGERRAKVEQFLRDIGIDPAASNSRNPLEQPWNLTEAEFGKRTKKLAAQRKDVNYKKLYELARDTTAALTEKIAKVEREIDERVATLYGLNESDIAKRGAKRAKATAE